MKKTQLINIAAAIILMMAPVTVQILIRDSSDETRWQEYQSQSFISNIKRHSEGTFSSDLTRYLDKMKAKDFIQWLMDKKRFSKRHLESGLKIANNLAELSFLSVQDCDIIGYLLLTETDGRVGLAGTVS
ncbi:pro-glucagon-like [Pelobates fuscus]|uniref:pro-glucagon-like n=1 Tax=Pelobates fuscus TaxID=191477 RepID=UPI002FE4929B